MIRTIICSILVAVSGARAFATAQAPDVLIVGDKEEAIHCNPLAEYFDRYPEKAPKPGGDTSLWRGYVGFFEIRNGALWVRDIKIQTNYNGTTGKTVGISIIHKVIPSHNERKLDWFTGMLVLPRGKVVDYVHMAYGSWFEAYRLLFIHKGRVLANRFFTLNEYREYRALQLAAYEQSDEGKEERERMAQELGIGGRARVESFLALVDNPRGRDIPIDYKEFKPQAAIKERGIGMPSTK